MNNWYQNPKLIISLKKIVALLLLIYPLFLIYQSVQDILFVLPQLQFLSTGPQHQNLYLELVKKAILISISLFFDTFYGFTLLLKPSGATKIIHIIMGVILFIFSHLLFRLAAIDLIISQLEFLPIT